MYEILNNICDCPGILDLIKFNVPQYVIRKSPLFYIDTCNQFYALFSPLNGILASCNTVCYNVDFFCNKFSSFKLSVRSIVLD